MTDLKIYTEKDILALVNTRKGEKKFGEKVSFITNPNNISNTNYLIIVISNLVQNSKEKKEGKKKHAEIG